MEFPPVFDIIFTVGPIATKFTVDDYWVNVLKGQIQLVNFLFRFQGMALRVNRRKSTTFVSIIKNKQKDMSR